MKKNIKGFTLVELLAVIVVLAIIMVFAIPAVMNQMDNARVGTFRVYAQRAITKAQEQYQADLLFGSASDGSSKCYTLEKLGLTDGTYHGKVNVTTTLTGGQYVPSYTITLTDATRSVSALPSTSIETSIVPKNAALSAPLTKTVAEASCT